MTNTSRRRTRRALVVRGGWAGHQPVEATELFIPFLVEHGFAVEVHEDPAPYADTAFLAGVDLIVQCVTMGSIRSEEVAGLRAAVEAGTGLAGWHGGIVDSYRGEPDYLQLVGGQFAAHPGRPPEERTGGAGDHFVAHAVTIIDPTHPITSGVPDFELVTEQYWMLTDGYSRRAGDDDAATASRRSVAPRGRLAGGVDEALGCRAGVRGDAWTRCRRPARSERQSDRRAGAAVGEPVSAGVAADPVTVAVVGCGNISGQYLDSFSRLPNVRLVAVCDEVASAAARVAAERDVPARPLAELLADPAVELVVNLTPPQAHAPVSIAALRAGKHVYQEKPFAVGPDEAAAMLEAAAAAGRRIGCAPDTVLGTSIQTARRLVDEGEIGAPVGATAFMLNPGHESWHPNPAFHYQPGGGPLMDMGVYYLTALVTLLGPIVAVAAMGSRSRDDPARARRGAAGGRTARRRGRHLRHVRAAPRRWRAHHARRQLRHDLHRAATDRGVRHDRQPRRSGSQQVRRNCRNRPSATRSVRGCRRSLPGTATPVGASAWPTSPAPCAPASRTARASSSASTSTR